MLVDPIFEPENRETLLEQIATIEKNIAASRAAHKSLKARLDKQAFAGDPNVTRLISEMLDAAGAGDRKKFSEASQRAHLYARRVISMDERKTSEIIKEQSQKPFGIKVPNCFGMKRTYIPAGLPSFLGGFGGQGKSTSALNLIYELWEQQKRILYVSLEMTRAQVLNRFLSIHKMHTQGLRLSWQEAFDLIRSGEASDFIDNEVSPLIHIKEREPGERFTCDDFLQYHEWYCQRYGDAPEIVILDYIGNLAGDAKDQYVTLTNAVRSITQYSKHTNHPWLILSQTNREASRSNGAPGIAGFKGSSAFDEDGALLITIGRHYGPLSYDAIEVRAVKNRMGPLESAFCKVDKETSAFCGTLTLEEVKSWKR